VKPVAEVMITMKQLLKQGSQNIITKQLQVADYYKNFDKVVMVKGEGSIDDIFWQVM
jgi:exonuclease VII large subunit